MAAKTEAPLKLMDGIVALEAIGRGFQTDGSGAFLFNEKVRDDALTDPIAHVTVRQVLESPAVLNAARNGSFPTSLGGIGSMGSRLQRIQNMGVGLPLDEQNAKAKDITTLIEWLKKLPGAK